MATLNTPTGVDTYRLPTDDTAASAAVLALLNGATTKIRLAMYSLTDDAIISAIIAADLRGLDILLALDWHQAHLHWEQQAIALMRAALTPAKVVYTTAPVTHMQMQARVATIDDATTIDGSTNWATEAISGEQNQLLIIRSATLTIANSATIDALAAWGAAHLPQT